MKFMSSLPKINNNGGGMTATKYNVWLAINRVCCIRKYKRALVVPPILVVNNKYALCIFIYVQIASSVPFSNK